MQNILLTATILYGSMGVSETNRYVIGPQRDTVCETHLIATELLGSILRRARQVCYEKYGPRSPCLVKFEQVGPEDYQATCGAKIED